MNTFIKTYSNISELVIQSFPGTFGLSCLHIYSWCASQHHTFKIKFNYVQEKFGLSAYALRKVFTALEQLGLMVYTRGGIKRGSGWAPARVYTNQVETPKPAPTAVIRRDDETRNTKRDKINKYIPVLKKPPTPKPEPKPKNPNAGVIENAFLKLWEQFPKKSETDKNKARWAWWQQTKELDALGVDKFLNNLLENVDFRLKNDHLWRENRFIPNIRNFLYERAWLRPVIPKPKEKPKEPTVVAQLSDRSWADPKPRSVETSDWAHPELSRTRDLTIDQQVLDCSWADQPSCLAELSRG